MRVMEKMWAISSAGLLALSMIAFWVWPKFSGDFHPVFGWAEAQSGVGWLDPLGRQAVGGIAVLIAFLLLVPRTRLFGAYAGFALSLAYMAFHLTPWLGVTLPDYGPMAATLQAGGTAADVAALGTKGDGGMWFAVAMTHATLALMAIVAERNLRKPQPKRRFDYASA